MHEAILYDKESDLKVRCKLCAHRCLIPPEKTGICAVRQNRGGTLDSLNYGKIIAANIDPIEKKPFYHFLPGSTAFSIATAGCNFRCQFCQNWDISQLSKNYRGEFPGELVSPESVVKQAVANGCESIAYTYTEPTIFFEFATDIARLASTTVSAKSRQARLAQKACLKNVFVTNGYQTPETIGQMTGLIDAANIDLKSFRDDYYREVCGARREPVLEAIKLMHQAGIWIEITTLVVPGQNDSEGELIQIAEFIAGVDQNIPWHLSRFHPDYQMTESQPTPLATLERAAAIGQQAGLNFVYLGNVPGNQSENTICPNCQKTIIERRGYTTVNHLDGQRCPFCHRQIPGIFG